MEKKINIKALVISLVFALISCILIFQYIKAQERPVEIKEKVQMLVAARSIDPGKIISEDDLITIEIFPEDMPSGILDSREQIVGMYAKDPILSGEPFRNQRLSTKEAMSLSFNIPTGMRGVSIFVNEDSIFSGQLGVGDRVDVIGSFKKEIEGTIMASSMIIIQNAEVLAVGASRFVSDAGQDNTKSREQENLARTVTLAVSPEDSEKLVFTTDFGDFTLALREKGEQETANTPGIIIDDVTPDISKYLPDLSTLPETEN